MRGLSGVEDHPMAPRSSGNVQYNILMSRPKIAVAPMMDWTDRHCRYFMRLLAPDMLLYTEMITAAAVLHGDPDRLLAFDPAEHPVALQLGGCEPAELAQAATIAASYGYDEINLTGGCPSDRVQSGRFGACLMAEPERVRDCVAAMRGAVAVPVTVKSRIGIDEHEDYEFLRRFVDIVAEGGCRRFVIHARKAILRGLSPKQNREVPPLRYDFVQRIKAETPELEIWVNGGIRSLAAVRSQLALVDGVMIGREAYHNPWILAEIEREIIGGRAPPSRHLVLERYCEYAARQLAAGVRVHQMSRHLLGLFAGCPGARAWRRRLSVDAASPDAGIEVLRAAAAAVEDAASAV
jgi:tRNA-dihydrouridine synthase A